MSNLTEKQAQRAFGRKMKKKHKTSRLVKYKNMEENPKKKPKMNKYTQKHAQVSFWSKLKEQNGHEILQKKQSAIQKSAKNKPKKQANYNQHKPKNKQPASLQKKRISA